MMRRPAHACGGSAAELPSFLLPFLLVSSGCAPDLVVPTDAVVLCREDGDCPSAQVCQPRHGICVASLDTTPPRLVAAAATSPISVALSFNEPLDATAVAALDSYAIDPPLTLFGARLLADGLSVELATERQAPLATYVVSAPGVTDLDGNVASSESQSFTGYGIDKDSRPPEPLTPAAGAVVLQAAVTLTWTPRLGATSYVVEIATDAGFATLVAKSPLTTDTPSVTVTLDDPITYFWRVRSDLREGAEGEAYGLSSFDRVVDTVYVYCDSSDAEDCARRRGDTGSRSRPFARPSQAIAAATAYGLRNVAIAARGGGAAYTDLLRLGGAQALTITGGYDSSFAACAPDANVTVIRSDALPVAISRNTAAVRLEGLTLVGRAIAASSALVVREPQAAVELLRLRLHSETLSHTESGTASTVDLIGGTGLITLDGCEITAGFGDFRSAGLVVEGARVAVRDTRISSGAALFSDAVWVKDAPEPVLLERCTIQSGQGVEGADGVRLGDAPDVVARLTLRESVVLDQSGVGESYGVHATYARDLLLERNLIAVGSAQAGSVAAIYFEDVAGALVRNNTLITRALANDQLFQGHVVRLERSPQGWSADAPVQLIENTLLLGSVPGAAPDPVQSVAVLALYASPAVVAGNIIATRTAGTRCVVENYGAGPATFSHNALLGCAQAYRPQMSCTANPSCACIGGTISCDTTAAVNSLDGYATYYLNGDTARFSDNIVASPPLTNVFTRLIEAADDDQAVADNELSLIGDDGLGLATAGCDPAAWLCGTHESAVACGIAGDDYAGAARTVPTSLGAFERDPY